LRQRPRLHLSRGRNVSLLRDAQRGQPAGHWTLNVKAGSDGTEIDEDSVATFMGVQMSAKAALVLGPDFSPVKYDGNYRAAGAQSDRQRRATSSQGNRYEFTQAPPAKISGSSPTARHLVIIDPGLAAGLFVLPARLARVARDSVTWVTPISAEAASLAAQSRAELAAGWRAANDVAIYGAGRHPREESGNDLVRSVNDGARSDRRNPIAERGSYPRTIA
jgi:hypothetical protein